MTMRGEQSVKTFASAMLSTLNTPKNKAKGPWSEMTMKDLAIKLAEEFEELFREIDCAMAGDRAAYANMCREASDLGAVSMMIHEHAERELIRMMAEARTGTEA